MAGALVKAQNLRKVIRILLKYLMKHHTAAHHDVKNEHDVLRERTKKRRKEKRTPKKNRQEKLSAFSASSIQIWMCTLDPM